MSLRKMILWFWSTLAIGASTVFLFTPFIHARSFSQQLLIGLTLAAVTELGFFSYLIFNWLCLGQLRSRNMFNIILVGLILVVLINFVYLSIHQPLPHSLVLVSIILGVAMLVSYAKVKQTNLSAFLPTLFFMIVATVLEATPSFQSRVGHMPFTILVQTVSVILFCNAWQILQLHRWVKKKSQLPNETNPQ